MFCVPAKLGANGGPGRSRVVTRTKTQTCSRIVREETVFLIMVRSTVLHQFLNPTDAMESCRAARRHGGHGERRQIANFLESSARRADGHTDVLSAFFHVRPTFIGCSASLLQASRVQTSEAVQTHTSCATCVKTLMKPPDLKYLTPPVRPWKT